MKTYLVADRYARSLVHFVANDDAEAKSSTKNLRDLSEVYAGSIELRRTLANPAVPETQRLAILDAVCERIGTSDVVRKLVATMLRRRRIDLLPAVAELFAAKTDERLGRVGVQVTSAAALSEERQNELKEALERYTGKTVRVEFATDPELLGGVVARIHDKILDGSIRSRIARLKNHLLPEENLGG